MIRRYLYASSIAMVTLAGLLLVAASPFALNPLARLDSNWVLLSNVGQTYGAISALLTAVGIPGIAISIALQVRESRRARAEALRSHHSEILRLAIEDPSLADISHASALMSHGERRQTIYINMQLEFWLMLWEMGALPADTLSVYAADLIQSQPGRRYWARFGPIRMTATLGAHKESKFLKIINDEYRRTAAQGSDAPDGNEASPSPSHGSNDRRLKYAVACAAVIGFALALRKAVRGNREL